MKLLSLDGHILAIAAAPHWRAGLLLVCLGVTTVACERPSVVAAGPLVIDSAGVRIITHDKATIEAMPGWRLALHPKLSIGRVAGSRDQELHQVRSAIRLRDGRIVAANNGTAEVRFYDPAGGFQHAIGRRGSGPGEFRSVGWLAQSSGDTILVFDPTLLRFSILSNEGRFIRTISLAEFQGASVVWPVGLMPDRSIVVSLATAMTGLAGVGVVQDSADYVRLTWDGEIRDTIGRFPVGERVVMSDGNIVSVLPRPFAAAGHAAVQEATLISGFADTFEIGTYSEAGVLRGLIRVDQQKQSISPSDIEAFRFARTWARSLESQYFPSSAPAFSRLLVDAQGNSWVQTYAGETSEFSEWFVFDGQGGMIRRTQFPTAFRPTFVDSTEVLGIWRDDLDVEYLQVYDMELP